MKISGAFVGKLSSYVFSLLALGSLQATEIDDIEGLKLAMPLVGTSGIRIVTPTLLELARVNSEPSGGPPDSWNFVDPSGNFSVPTGSYSVSVNDQTVAATVSGFRRRPLYTPALARDLRVDNRVFITLQTPLADNDAISVTTTGWEGGVSVPYQVTMDPLRRNAAIHINQEGYQTASPKKAVIGYYLGSSGELQVPASTFSVIDAAGQTVYKGNLVAKQDIGYVYTPAPYQATRVADFTALQTPGNYRLLVPGLGTSLPFRIDDGMLMNYVRAYALGLYNQRCGCAVQLPYSRHTHAACHTAAASIPSPQANFTKAWANIISTNSNPGHPAPRLDSEAAMLYPFVKTGTIDVSGGHHDAGDYSKYTINSAQLIHHLVFAVDSFPAVGALDNLGTPESGDGKSDLLQEAKYEADFLAKMQDDDGGFYFLVYPRDRKYEDTVLPENGDPQVVWPKNTSATAAAVGALAEIGSSPLFKAQFPVEAALYMQKAQAGWNFLLTAIATYGKDGSYQKLTAYGDIFRHDDELAWAASAMFAATGDPACQAKLISWFTPTAPATRRWSWWKLFEGYGCAARTYAFAVRSGRRLPGDMNASYLALCETEIINSANDMLDRSNKCAYGSSFEIESKRQRTGGWYFSSERAFDITTAQMIAPSAAYEDSVMSNVNFELGCNPVNISYITGSGQRQQREIVDQYAKNDTRILPPSGIPLGNIQTGFAYISPYGYDLGDLTFPQDGATTAPYPYYDRWGDSFNTTTEFVVAQQSRSLASLCYWAAKTPGASQVWSTTPASIQGPSSYVPIGDPVTFTLTCPGLDLTKARITWEAFGQEPAISGCTWTITPVSIGTQWVEAEAVMPDGRRVSARADFSTCFPVGGYEFTPDSDTLALYHFNGNFNDSSGNGYHLASTGNVQLINTNSGWMAHPGGQVARFTNIGDTLTVTFPDSLVSPGSTSTPLTLEAWIYPRSYKAYSVGNYSVLSLFQFWDSSLGAEDGKWNSPGVPAFMTGGASILTTSQWKSAITIGTWQHLRITRSATGAFSCWINDVCVSTIVASPNYGRTNAWTLTIGNINADVDEVRVSRAVR